MANSSDSYEDLYTTPSDLNTTLVWSHNDVRAEQVLVPILFGLIVILGIFGNIVVVAVLLRNRDHFKNTTNSFILNLSIADLLFLLFCVPFHAVIYATGSWPFGDATCKLVHFVQFSSMIASIFTLVVMAVDRYLAVVFGLKTVHLRITQVALVACGIVWIISIAIATPIPFVYTVKSYNFGYQSKTYVCAEKWPQDEHKKYYYLFLSVFTFVLPLFLILILSSMLVHKLWLRATPKNTHTLQALQRKRKVTRLICVIVSVFFLCWLPAHIIWIWVNFFPLEWPNTYSMYYFRIFAHFLSYSNSAMNPFLYTFMSANFRHGFNQAVQCRDTRRSPMQTYTFAPNGTLNTPAGDGRGVNGRSRKDRVLNRDSSSSSRSSDAYNLIVMKTYEARTERL